MQHTYEELRSAALDILAGREKVTYEATQYEHLSLGVGEVLARREGRTQAGYFPGPGGFPLDPADKQLLLELFWDLFRQGVISLGMNDSNREFPFFHLTRLGHQLAKGQEAYFFHDVSSYEAAIRREVPAIDAVTLLYLKEAMQAFRAGCMLSATVMLGVSAEHTFETLLEQLNASAAHSATFGVIFKERTLLRRFNKFRAVLDSLINTLPADVKEDLDTNLAGILSVIRTYRNESGHPTGKIIDREQTFVLLQLFIPYCKKQHQLMRHFSQ